MANFDRNTPWEEKSFAYRRFIRHQEELNTAYWAQQLALARTLRTIKAPRAETETSVLKVLEFGHKGKSDLTLRCNWSVAAAETNLSKSRGYFGTLTIIAIASYLETLLRNLSNLAMLSRPAALLGKWDVIDGVTLLKSKKDFLQRFEEDADKLASGKWADRIGRLGSTLSVGVAIQDPLVRSLDEMQSFRNRVAHQVARRAFTCGIETETDRDAASEKRVKKCLADAAAAARIFETSLAPRIGCFEVLHSYHLWLNTKAGKELHLKGTPKQRARAFSTSSVEPMGIYRALGINYCLELDKYYSSV